MRALIQRVSKASVCITDEPVAQIGPGLLVLVCAMHGDTDRDAETLATRTAKLRIFPDGDGRMNRSLLYTQGSALIVSQVTLAADTSRGNRPDFSTAAAPTGESASTCISSVP